MNRIMSAEARRTHWAETLATDGRQTWDWRQELSWLISYNRGYLAFLVGPAFRMPYPKTDNTPWPPEPSGLVSDAGRAQGTKPSRPPKTWAMSDSLWRLGLYGRYGVLGEDVAPKKRTKHVTALVTDATALLRYSPFALAADFIARPTSPTILPRIAKLAMSRRALEQGEGYVDPASLALLGGVSEGRIRNLMSEGRTFQSIRGAVAAQSASQWLAERPAFWDSIWQKDPAPSS